MYCSKHLTYINSLNPHNSIRYAVVVLILQRSTLKQKKGSSDLPMVTDPVGCQGPKFVHIYTIPHYLLTVPPSSVYSFGSLCGKSIPAFSIPRHFLS